MNASHLTVRNLPPKVIAALQAERKRRGVTLNQTVVDLLGQALGVTGTRSNGLARFGGTWTEEQFQEFEKATEFFETIDPELWA